MSLALETLDALSRLRDELAADAETPVCVPGVVQDGSGAGNATPRPSVGEIATPGRQRRKRAAGELVLRRSVGAYSGGTRVRVLRGVEDGDGILVEPVDVDGEPFIVSAWDLQHRRGVARPLAAPEPPPAPEPEPEPEPEPTPEPAREPIRPEPVALAPLERDRRPVLVLADQTVLELAERRGVRHLERKVEDAIACGRKRRTILSGERLPPGLRHVLVDGRTVAIVQKLPRTAGGRKRYRVLHLMSRPRAAA